MVERLLSLDPARRCGFCFGLSNRPPSETVSGAVQLLKPGEHASKMPGRAGKWLLSKIREWRPTMIVCEDWMAPTAMDSDDVVVNGLFVQAAFLTVGSIYDLPMWHINVMTWRKHFCGRASAMPHVRGAPKRTSRQKEEARQANKRMVFDRSVMLGFIPKDAPYDPDRADSTGIWDYGAHHYARDAVAPLVLFQGK